MLKKNRTLLKGIKEHRAKYFMLLPGVILLIFFQYLPMFGSIIAFKEINYRLGIFNSPWIGLKNFQYLVSTDMSFVALRNTILYNLVFIITGMVGSITLAIMLNEIRQKSMAKIYQVVIIMPHFISMVVVSYLVYAFLGFSTGFINQQLVSHGLEPIQWYMKPEYWPFIILFVNAWKTWGIGTVIYLATMASFDPCLYEAARIDGANKYSQIKNITIPLLLPIITILFLLSLGRIFNSDFGLFYQVTRASGPIIETTQTLDTYVYRSLMILGDIGMASAAAFFQSVVGLILIITTNLILRKTAPERSLF